MPSAASCKCFFSRTFVIRLLNFHEISKATPKALTISKNVVIVFHYFFQWCSAMVSQSFCRGISLKEPKVESYNLFCFAFIFSYQLQLSHCPSTQPRPLSFPFLCCCPAPFLWHLCCCHRQQWLWNRANTLEQINLFLVSVVSPGRLSPFLKLIKMFLFMDWKALM